MTDIITFKALLTGAKIDFEEVTRSQFKDKLCEYEPDLNGQTVIVVNPGCMSHFEAEFGGIGKLIAMGQFQTY
jgi:hypothetical protein